MDAGTGGLVADRERRSRFEHLYVTTYGAILGYVLRRLSDPSDAADVVAETYLTLWRRLEDVPADDRVLPWLYGVARRILANQRRGERRRTALAGRLAADVQNLATYIREPGGPTAEQIARAFRRLSGDDRELLALVAWEDLGRDEIAVVLGISRPLVRLRLHRARQRLTKELSAEGIDMQRPTTAGHDMTRRVPARPGATEATP
jgi:RNA polymerase sigma factor (sigma-70 family)